MEKTKAWRYPVAVVVFWLLVRFGGLIPILFNVITPKAFRYEEGTIWYLLLQIVANAIGVIFANYAIDSITEGKHPLFCLVNCVIAATYYIIMIVIYFWMQTWTIPLMISMILATVVLIVCAISFGSKISGKKGEGESG